MNKLTAIRILAAIYFVVLFFLCFSDFSGLEGVPEKFMGLESDKITHFLMFFPMIPLSYYALLPQRKTLMRCIGKIIVFFVIGCIIAMMTEFIQEWFTSTRHADVADFKADAVSLGVASIAVFIREALRK